MTREALLLLFVDFPSQMINRYCKGVYTKHSSEVSENMTPSFCETSGVTFVP